MAIHEGYDKINRITGLDIPWEGKTGVEVEDFIKCIESGIIKHEPQEEKRNIYLQFRGSTNQKVFTHKGKYKNYNN